MYAIPYSSPDHWPRLIMDGLGNLWICRQDKAAQLEAQRARAAHARSCRQAKAEFLLKQADLFAQETQEIGTRTGARSATARAPISPFSAPETEAAFFVRGRSSTAYQSHK